MIIRRETPSEFGKIYELVKTAFQTAKVSNGKEQEYVDELRSGGNYIPELALVAEEEGELVGHIMLTKAHIINEQNQADVLLLAPISVVEQYRHQGIGSALIHMSFKLAREMGFKAVVLVGDPNFYNRFGFKTAAQFGVKSTHPIPDENVMVCELIPNSLEGVNGKVDCF